MYDQDVVASGITLNRNFPTFAGLCHATCAGYPLVLYHQNIEKYRNQKTKSLCRFSLLLHSLNPFSFYLNKTLTDNI